MKKFLVVCSLVVIYCIFSGYCTSHNLTVSLQEDALCVTAGRTVYKCTKCDYEEVKTIPATGHKMASETVREATCTETGLIRLTCFICGATDETVVPKQSHAYEYRMTKEPSMEETGLETGVCSYCGIQEERQVTRLGETKSNPVVVSVSELVAEIKNDKDAAQTKYNGKWVKITGEVKSVYTVAGLNGYYLYGKRSDSGLRIICWCDSDSSSTMVVGKKCTFLGQVREITTINATEIGDCTMITD